MSDEIRPEHHHPRCPLRTLRKPQWSKCNCGDHGWSPAGAARTPPPSPPPKRTRKPPPEAASAGRDVAEHADRVIEHAIRMTSGAMQVRFDHPDIERIFPLAEWIRSEQRFGGRVFRRVITVVEDWEEVPRGRR